MTFKSRKDIVLFVLINGLLIFLSYMLYLSLFGINKETPLIASIIIALCMLLLISIFYFTRYKVDAEHIYYRSGPFRGKIKLEDVHEIIVNKTLWVGYRPATATKGLVVKYNKYDEIYFSPDSNETFIKYILEQNPNIKITHSKK